MSETDFLEYEIVKPLVNLIYLLDTSGSMQGEPINQLNVAMQTATLIAENLAMKNEVRLCIRVVQFNTFARWLYGDTEHGVEHIDWVPLKAGGGTDTAGAIELARSVMHREYLGTRIVRPVVILISDGMSNEPERTAEAIAELKASMKNATNPEQDMFTRIAIAVSGAKREELENFASIGNIEHEDGMIDEGVPLVFDVNDIGQLHYLLEIATYGGLTNSIYNSSLDGLVTIKTAYEELDDSEWEWES